jgi:hypothetical protein
MNNKIRATKFFVNNVEGDDDAYEAYDMLSTSGDPDERANRYVDVWEPHQDSSVDELLVMIDDLAENFDEVYQIGRAEGTQSLMNSVNRGRIEWKKN